jgi:hypothetical protein
MEDKNARKPIEVPLRGRPRKRDTDSDYFPCTNMMQEYFEEKNTFGARPFSAQPPSSVQKPDPCMEREQPCNGHDGAHGDMAGFLDFEDRLAVGYSKGRFAREDPADMPRKAGFLGQGKASDGGHFYAKQGNREGYPAANPFAGPHRPDFDQVQNQKQFIDTASHTHHESFMADGYRGQFEPQRPATHQAMGGGFSYDGIHEPMRPGHPYPKYPPESEHASLGGYGNVNNTFPPQGHDFLEMKQHFLQAKHPFKQEALHPPFALGPETLSLQTAKFQEYPQRMNQGSGQHMDLPHPGGEAAADYERRMTASLFLGSGQAQWPPLHGNYAMAEGLGHTGPWMSRKKRKNNPLLWQYIKSNQAFHPNVIHPSKYSSLDFIQGNDAGQKTYLGTIKRTLPEKDNSNSILPLFLSSNKEMTEDFRTVIQNFKSALDVLDFNNVTVHQLKSLMKEFGLNHTGKKNELIERLQSTLKKIDGKEEEARMPEKIERRGSEDDFGYYFF